MIFLICFLYYGLFFNKHLQLLRYVLAKHNRTEESFFVKLKTIPIAMMFKREVTMGVSSADVAYFYFEFSG